MRAGGGAGGQLGQRQRLGFGDGRLAGAFQDEVPGVGVVEGAGAVQRRAEPAEQGGVAELDVPDVPGGGADPRRLGRVGAVAPGGLRASAASRRSRKLAALCGGPGGAVTARTVTAYSRSA